MFFAPKSCLASFIQIQYTTRSPFTELGKTTLHRWPAQPPLWERQCKWQTCPSLKFRFIEAGVLRCMPLQINKRTVPPASPGRHRPSSTRTFVRLGHPFLLLLQLLPIVLLVVFPTVHPVIQLQENHKVTTAAAAAYRLTRTNKILHVHKLELECSTYHR